MIEIDFGSDNHDGGVQIFDDTVQIWTDHCGCYAETQDRAVVLKIYHALGDWLIATNPELSDPDERMSP